MATLVFKVASSGGGGGGDIPSSITARDNLIHWWKMSEDPSGGSIPNSGLSASSELSMSLPNGATQTSGGPTEIDSPSYLVFNGVDEYGQVTVVNSGTNTDTTVNDVLAGDNFSISFWVQILQGSGFSPDDGVFVAANNALFNDGVGLIYESTYHDRFNSFVGGKTNGGANIFGGKASSVPANYRSAISGSWAHVTQTYSSGSGEWKVYIDGSLATTRTLNHEYPTYNARVSGSTNNHGSYMLFAAAQDTWPVNSALNVGHHLGLAMVDFRMYNITLDSTQVSSIASGDWS